MGQEFRFRPGVYLYQPGGAYGPCRHFGNQLVACHSRRRPDFRMPHYFPQYAAGAVGRRAEDPRRACYVQIQVPRAVIFPYRRIERNHVIKFPVHFFISRQVKGKDNQALYHPFGNR